MSPSIELFERLKSLIDFGSADAANLVALADVVEKHGGRITDAFYKKLGETREVAPLIEGRVEALKKTHRQWMKSITAGDYGPAYLESRWRIGLAHVRIGLEPHWVEGVMSFIRTSMMAAIAQEVSDPRELVAKQASFVKACDLDLMVINLSYGEERLERLTTFTGMKRALLENIIRLPKK